MNNLVDYNYRIENFEYIAFVDIDGVLNHMQMKCTYEFLKESVDVLNDLYEKYNIQLVLSSSWRHAYSFAFMQKLFKDNGIKAPLIDKTYICFNNNEKKVSLNLSELLEEDYDDEYIATSLYTRDNEIYEWVKMFKPKHFVILDDFKMHGQFLQNHQWLTYYWGEKKEDLALRLKHLPKIYKILEKENELLKDTF